MKVKVYLDYQCFPIWTYDSNGILIDNDFPQELRENQELRERFQALQEKYNRLFIDNEIEFKYMGFESEEDRLLFQNEMNSSLEILRDNLRSDYQVEIKVKI
jgi:hypothetical protein